MELSTYVGITTEISQFIIEHIISFIGHFAFYSLPSDYVDDDPGIFAKVSGAKSRYYEKFFFRSGSSDNLIQLFN